MSESFSGGSSAGPSSERLRVECERNLDDLERHEVELEVESGWDYLPQDLEIDSDQDSASESDSQNVDDPTEILVTCTPQELNMQPSAPSTQTNLTLPVNPAAGKCVLSLYEKCFASESDRKELMSDIKLVAKECMRELSVKVNTALSGANLKLCDMLDVEKSISSTCKYMFAHLDTKAQQEKYFKEIIGVTEVQRCPLGRVFIRGRKGAVMNTKVIEHELMLVLLEETVNKLVNHPDYKNFKKDESGGNNNLQCLDSYMKGELAKENKILQEHPDALRFILYYDDLEVCSPLKSRAGKHKVGAFYVFLDNILPKFRSSLKVICLISLVNATFIKGQYYGMDAALEIIVNQFKKFEEGTLKCGKKVFGTLIPNIGDNLGQHSLGGFKEGFTAHRICRFCMARYDVELKTITTEDASLLRSKEQYQRHIREFESERGKNEKGSKEFGLNRESCLNRLETFHVLDNMPPDLLHDLLEGSLSFTMKKMLHHFLYEQDGEKPFTLEWLNQAIQNFDFDYSEIKDKPSELKAEHVKDNSTVSLHQSAAQLCLLGIILPLILCAHIDPEDAHWENFLDILEICRVCFTLEFPLYLVPYLRDLTDKYLSSFIELSHTQTTFYDSLSKINFEIGESGELCLYKI